MSLKRSIPDKILDPYDLEDIADALDIGFHRDYCDNKREIHTALKQIEDPITLLYNHYIDGCIEDTSTARLAMYLMSCKVRDSWSDEEFSAIFKYVYLIYRVVSTSREIDLLDYNKDSTYIIPSEVIWSVTGHCDEGVDEYFWICSSVRPEVIAYTLNEVKRLLDYGIYEPLKVIDALYERILNHTNLDPANAMLVALSRNDAYTKLLLSLYEGNTQQVADIVGLIAPYDVKIETYVEQSKSDLEFLSNDDVSYFIPDRMFTFNQPCGLLVPRVRLTPNTSTTIVALIGNSLFTRLMPLPRFHIMSDKAIMEEFGVRIPHTSRVDLFCKYIEHENGELHFYSYLDNSKFVGMDSPICYNTINSTDRIYGIGQHFYILDDLVEAIRIENGIVRICIPPLPSRPSIEHIEELIAIMQHCNEEEVVGLLKLFIEQSQDPLVIDRSLIIDSLKPKFKTFLINLIYMGLYARRWRGEGHPIPYTRSSTDAKVRTYENRIQKLIVANTAIMESKGFSDISEYIYPHDFNKKRTHGLFIPSYMEMCLGTKCIREMSESLIGTGSHYLRELYNETLLINGEPLELHRFEFMNPIAPEERSMPTA